MIRLKKLTYNNDKYVLQQVKEPNVCENTLKKIDKNRIIK